MCALFRKYVSYLKGPFKWILASGSAFEVVRGDVLVDGGLDDVHDPGGGIVAEVSHCNS